MRIIAGRLGGRMFDAPHGHHTHPMSDKMRGALFNILGDIAGLTVLDAFGGSGALGLEALSRGAAGVLFTENDRNAQRTIEHNLQELGLTAQANLVQVSAGTWLHTNPDAHFDIVLCDPPYDDLQMPLLQRLAKRIHATGIFVLSYPGQLDAPELAGLDTIKQQNYGDGQLIFYRPKPPELVQPR